MDPNKEGKKQQKQTPFTSDEVYFKRLQKLKHIHKIKLPNHILPYLLSPSKINSGHAINFLTNFPGQLSCSRFSI
ncbi:hypothetical protein ES332_D08G204700v1 [Gossypium tomentosum]|uniref:Uncharacterized protein n=1 Tax=Gossypium tomentosum TaxID=34277 RepID=A0A5D2JXC3_GOSTO|nr:hypothetical protein ES332_D08G204700v1 [Gossypium tomentosum]